MKIVRPSVEFLGRNIDLTPEEGLQLVERAARTCYKSEEKATSDSAKKMVNMLINKGHYAMLEHLSLMYEITVPYDYDMGELYMMPYVHISIGNCEDKEIQYFVTISMRHIVDTWGYKLEDIARWSCLSTICAKMAGLFYKEYYGAKFVLPINLQMRILNAGQIQMPEIHNRSLNEHTTYTYKIICDRGVSHELVRHRCSFAQESTRYCNYSQDKFCTEIQIVPPSTFHDWKFDAQVVYLDSMCQAEKNYFEMLHNGCAPQDARAVLPNSLKTEIIMTASEPQWNHFFDLRLFGKTGKPHPDMRIIAQMIYDDFCTRL